ncbi:restriction endonuclease subunit S [Prevotella sp.]|uniref:restriction endonuclease subunit S n=1 Tax=Prevotella sp. TaxID=59823 RepID=UPI0030770B27
MGEWEEHKLEDITAEIGDGIHATPIYDDNGTFYFVNGNNISEYGITITATTQTVTEEEALRNNASALNSYSILLSINGTVGNVALYKNESIMLGKSACYINVSSNINRNYIFYYLMMPKCQFYFTSELTGTTIKNLSLKSIRKTKVLLPNANEQSKIARLFDAINERIATQNKIIEDLKKLKSAIVEKVFCSPNQEYPMCRIEGFEQALSTYKMSDFSSRIASKNKDSKCSLVLTIAAQYGLVNQESFFNKSVASDNLTGYYLLHKGEFAYNRSYSAGYDWGAVKRLDNYDEGVLSTLYICFKINETIVDSDYLAYYFESSKWHKGLSDIAGEGARNHGLLNVSITDYFNTKHRFPVIEEQKAIAKMLNTITEKERKATLLGECYQKQKQYLLRQMFI